MTIKFNDRCLDDAEASNYFGGLNGESQTDITSLRAAWITEMGKLGFKLGTEYDFDVFELAADVALTSCLTPTVTS